MGWYSRLFEETNELTQEKESLFSRLKRAYVITQLWLVPLEPGVTQYETVQFKCKWRIPQRIHPHLYNFIPDFKTPLECTIFAQNFGEGALLLLGLPKWLSGLKKKIPLLMQEMHVPCLDWEDSLEEEMGTHSSILAWKTPWTEESGGLQPMGFQSRTWLSNWVHTFALFLLLSISSD